MKRQGTYLFLLLILFASCEKRSDFEVKSADLNFIVVDALLTNEVKNQLVSLSYPLTQLNGNVRPVTGASVLISNEDSVYLLNESPVNSGKYVSMTSFSAQAGKHYTLKVIHGTNIYTAKAQMVTGMDFVPLRYMKNGLDNLYRILWVSNPYNPNRPAMYEVLLDWSHVPGYQNYNQEDCKSRMMVYTLPTLDVSEVFSPSKEKILFPLGTKITERRYSLTNEHAEFLREMLMETDWQGGFFNTAPANITTNLSSGARGFFGVCAVTSKEIEVIK